MFDAKNLLKNSDSKIPLGVLVSMIHRTHMIYVNNKMKENDLTASQLPFLMVLSNEEGVNQDEIAAHFHLDKGTVARALKKLEDKNYLFREVDTQNRRKHLIYLTEKGKSIIPKIVDVDNEWENSLCSQFSNENYSQLFNTLKVLAMNGLEKIDENGEKY